MYMLSIAIALLTLENGILINLFFLSFLLQGKSLFSMKATAELEGNDSLLNGFNELPEDKNVCGENAKTQSFSYWLVANRNSSTAYVISPLDTRHKDEHKEETNRDPKFFLPYDEIVKNKKIARKTGRKQYDLTNI